MKIAYLDRPSSETLPGHLPASRYVRRFWSPLVGIAAVGCYIVMSEAIDDGCEELSPVEICSALGLDSREALAGPLANLTNAGIVVGRRDGVLVRRTAPSLTENYESHLPPALREAHRRLRCQGLITNDAGCTGARAATKSTSPETERARLLALSLLRMGVPPSDVEREMHKRRLHPALAYQAAIWAIERHSSPISDQSA